MPFGTLRTWANGEKLPGALERLDKQAADPFSGALEQIERGEKTYPDLGAFGR